MPEGKTYHPWERRAGSAVGNFLNRMGLGTPEAAAGTVKGAARRQARQARQGLAETLRSSRTGHSDHRNKASLAGELRTRIPKDFRGLLSETQQMAAHKQAKIEAADYTRRIESLDED